MHQEHALAQTGDRLLHGATVERLTARCAFESLHHAHLVAFRLQSTNKPGARVGQSAVVEIYRVLCGQNDTQSVGTRLLEQREQQHLAGRIRDRRHVAEQFVDVQNGA